MVPGGPETLNKRLGNRLLMFSCPTLRGVPCSWLIQRRGDGCGPVLAMILRSDDCFVLNSYYLSIYVGKNMNSNLFSRGRGAN